MGIVGSGLATKRAAPAYLRAQSLAASPKNTAPRDIREQQYLQLHYGAPAADVQKAAPISGFLKTATQNLAVAQQKGITAQAYNAALQKAAQAQKGDQSKAVAYMKALAAKALAAKQAPKKKK